MGTININVKEVIGLSSQLLNTKKSVSKVKYAYDSIRHQIDDKILNRNNLRNRFQTVYSQIASVEKKVFDIQKTVELGGNSYRQTDLNVLSWAKEIEFKRSSSGGIGIILSGAAFAFDNYDEERKKKKKDKGDWSLEGAVVSGKKTTSGKVLGMSASGTAEGSLISGSASTSAGAEWDLEEKNVSIGVSAEAEGHLAEGSLEGNIGLMNLGIGGSVGNVGAIGTIGATLYSNGKFSPSLEAKVKAEASVAEGNASGSFGTDDVNVHVEAEGSFLAAEAEASANAGVITYEDTKTGKLKTEYGVSAKAGAEAYVAQGEVSGGFTLFGIDIDVGISGKAGGVGAAAEARMTTGGVSGEIGVGLGLGLGLELSIDWSDFSLW